MTLLGWESNIIVDQESLDSEKSPLYETHWYHDLITYMYMYMYAVGMWLVAVTVSIKDVVACGIL